MIRITKYEIALVIIAVVVFSGGMFSALVIIHDIDELHQIGKINKANIEIIKKNLEGNVTIVNNTFSFLQKELKEEEYKDYLPHIVIPQRII